MLIINSTRQSVSYVGTCVVQVMWSEPDARNGNSYDVDRRPDDRWFESHFGKNVYLRNFGNSVYPASQGLSDETVKAVGPFYMVSMPGEVKDPTSPHGNV